MNCALCNIDFNPHHTQKYCSPECHRKQRSIDVQKFRLAHPERVKAIRQKSRTGANREKYLLKERLLYRKNFEKNRERDNARQRARYAANPSKWCKYSLKKVYWTVEAYQQKKEEQNYACAICGIHENNLRRQLSADHNHIANKTRGLLCGLCNTALERLDNIPDWAHKAVEYLQRYGDEMLTVRIGSDQIV